MGAPAMDTAASGHDDAATAGWDDGATRMPPRRGPQDGAGTTSQDDRTGTTGLARRDWRDHNGAGTTGPYHDGPA